MIDKIKAEADAIPCGKDEKIRALEALLKLALKERDEALAYAERLRGSFEYALKDGLTEQAIKMILAEPKPTALAALKAQWQAEAITHIIKNMENVAVEAESVNDIQHIFLSKYVAEVLSKYLESITKCAQEAGE